MMNSPKPCSDQVTNIKKKKINQPTKQTQKTPESFVFTIVCSLTLTTGNYEKELSFLCEWYFRVIRWSCLSSSGKFLFRIIPSNKDRRNKRQTNQHFATPNENFYLSNHSQ